MRILIVTNYYEPEEGAAAVIITRLARYLAGQGHAVTVLTSAPNYPHGRIHDRYRGRFSVSETRDGVRVISTWLWATPSPRISRKFLSQITFMLTAALRGLILPRPDVMLVEAAPIFTNLAGVFLSLIKRVPYVLDVHDLWPDHMLTVGAMTERHPAYRIARWLVNHTYRRAAQIIAASPTWAEAIQQHIGQAEKMRIVYFGTNLNRFHPHLDSNRFREQHRLSEGKLITFIGTLATQYDFDTLLAVVERFRDRNDVAFVFIGSGSQSELIRQHMNLNPQTPLRWIEWINHAEIPYAWCASTINFWALRKHDLFRGTIPFKLYEALASGTPIVVAAEDVTARIIRDSQGGIVVPFEDVTAMADAISGLLDDPARREQLSHSARTYAEEHFDADKAAQTYEAALTAAVKP